MSARIKLSYTENGELTEVYKLLAPMVDKILPKPQKGKYKRTYFTLKSIPKNGGKPPDSKR